ncbi:GATA type transcriptional activator of nitrogen-regulated proteins [Coemansia interrupta]|uniref:GATA type transcriptional activator of nitrogen-regulated proteins n=1 Tax=Coemansia interrupta TaxID=1126814 RepID=A0A9W8HRE3_9FUNG|nr:GATA type transcriptional activator of nitrogen-regulated proteins [Coemansia interrupta]
MVSATTLHAVETQQQQQQPNHPFSISSLIDGPVPGMSAKTAASEGTVIKGTSCMNCNTTSTPLWRRDPTTGGHLCNRCGLYLKTYNIMHPLTKIKRRAITTTAGRKDAARAKTYETATADIDDVEQMPRPANCHPAQLQQVDVRVIQKRRVTPKQQISLGMTPKCFNCCAEQTPLWRRDPEDNIICNACGLYYKLHGKARPVSMKRAQVKRRNRTNVHQQRDRQGSVAGLSVPADPMASAPGQTPKAAGGAATPLDFLMMHAAAELSSPLSGAGQLSKTNKTHSGLSMLESLATVAAAEITSSSSSSEPSTPQSAAEQVPLQGADDRQKLQQECERLEGLLAQSKAMLRTLV